MCVQERITRTYVSDDGQTNCGLVLTFKSCVSLFISSSRKNNAATLAKCIFYRTRVRSLAMLVSNSLTHSLTDSCLVNLIDVTLACELELWNRILKSLIKVGCNFSDFIQFFNR